MLIKFEFKNYKSFRDEASLDLQAAPLEETKFQVRTHGKEKILPIAAIYGANASGKSNVIDAFGYMVKYVLLSFGYEDAPKVSEGKDLLPAAIRVPGFNPFRFGTSNETENAVSQFEIWFTVPGDKQKRTFNYGFALDMQGVREEWMNVKARTVKSYQPVFWRENLTVDFSSKIKKGYQSLLRESLKPRNLLVSMGGRLNIDLLKTVLDWFKDVQVINFGDPVENAVASLSFDSDFIDDDKRRTEYITFLSAFDDSIRKFEIDEIPQNDKNENNDKNEKYVDIRTVHLTADGREVQIPLNEESDGTLKMLALYPMIYQTLTSGGVLFVDELNSRLHPFLLRLIIQMFADPEMNPNDAQLIFTLHDIWQLKDNILRRDEIWFTEKNESGISELYSLYDFEDEDGHKIRIDEDYLRNYTLGKYGGIPQIKSLDRMIGNGLDEEKTNG
ncbi:ATP-binding protein [Erysipelotrichaceae bacterium 51-3]